MKDQLNNTPLVDMAAYKASSAFTHGILFADVEKSAASIGMTADEANAWLKYMHEVDWTFTDGGKVNCRNFRRSLRMWHKTEARISERGESKREAKAEQKRREAEEAEKQRLKSAAMDPGSWELCKERCAFAKEPMGCAFGMKIPPSAFARPIPPQECPKFKPKEVAA